MPLVSAGSQREPDLIHTPMATERRCSMRSVSTIRPFGNTVRRRFRSVVISSSSNSIVGPSGGNGTLAGEAWLCEMLDRGRPLAMHGRPKYSMLTPAMTGNSSQLLSLDAQSGFGGSPRALFGLDAGALTACMVDAGQAGWRGRQLAEAIYRQRVTDLNAITTLPKTLRGKLKESGWAVGRPQIEQVFRSVDGTERYLVHG